MHADDKLGRMKTSLLPEETIIVEGGANLLRGAEHVGGRLYLTNRRLIFESHALNFQSGDTTLDLDSVDGTEPCWTRFLGFLPLAPNSVAVRTKDAKEYRFALFDRTRWKQQIDSQRRKSSGPLIRERS